MVSTADVKFYLVGAAGLGGTISATQILHATFNNLFGNVTGAERIAGEDYYLCMAVKNFHNLEKMDKFNFWLDTDSPPNDTTIKWGFDAAGKNGTAQTIANLYVAPTSVTWHTVGNEPAIPNVGLLDHGDYVPIWVWWHVEPNAASRTDDTAIFNFTFFIPGGGTPDPGSGGGSFNVDTFGILKIYPTKAAGLEWFSTLWNNGNTRSLAIDEFDPDDARMGYHRGSGSATMDIDGAGVASFNTSSSSHRVFIDGPWTNTEMTVYFRSRNTYSSFQMRSRNNHHGVQDLPYGLESTSPEISCGFGSYEAIWLPNQNKAGMEVEVIHDLYVRELAQVTSAKPPNNTWNGYKQVTRTVEGKVIVTSYINRNVADQTAWTKETEMIYDGTNVHVDPTGHEINVSTCIGLGDNVASDLDANTLWLNPGKWCWLRMNDADDLDLKFFSVREIDPNAPAGGPVGGGGTGGGGSGGGGGNPPPAPTDWKMAVAGDWGCGSTTNKVHDLAKTYDFILGVGDNAYASASCWTSTFQDVKTKMNSGYGNHEYEESGKLAPYLTFFAHSKTYFSFDFQNVHILVLDSNASKVPLSPGSAQHDFATADLTAQDSRSQIDWIFVVMHHPWYTPGGHHPANEFSQVQAFHQLFTDHKVDFVMCGHNHNWQRTHQIAYSGTVSAPTIIDSSSPYVHGAGGLMHIVTGTGGHDSGSNLYSLSSQPAFQAYQNRTNNGIWEIVASNNAKTLTCSFVNINGDKFDTFVITTT